MQCFSRALDLQEKRQRRYIFDYGLPTRQKITKRGVKMLVISLRLNVLNGCLSDARGVRKSLNAQGICDPVIGKAGPWSDVQSSSVSKDCFNLGENLQTARPTAFFGHSSARTISSSSGSLQDTGPVKLEGRAQVSIDGFERHIGCQQDGCED
ncbi:hypothetical protein KCU73_g82, partial [Aureobasidium melanogenum]